MFYSLPNFITKFYKLEGGVSNQLISHSSCVWDWLSSDEEEEEESESESEPESTFSNIADSAFWSNSSSFNFKESFKDRGLESRALSWPKYGR